MPPTRQPTRQPTRAVTRKRTTKLNVEQARKEAEEQAAIDKKHKEEYEAEAKEAERAGFVGLLNLLGGAKAVEKLVDSSRGRVIKTNAFQHDVACARERLHRRRRGLLNPRSKFSGYWDLTTSIALFFVVFVTPLIIENSKRIRKAMKGGLVLAFGIVPDQLWCRAAIGVYLVKKGFRLCPPASPQVITHP